MFGMFIHANVNVRFGKLKYFLNSPELHLWHHANYREVFHANFATKFSMWDYMFGTVYFPENKPGDLRDNWGLYYDYPKDYFLQHAFSVKRFDEQKLLRYRWFNWYYNLRPRLLEWMIGQWKNLSKSVSKKKSTGEPAVKELEPEENYISCD